MSEGHGSLQMRDQLRKFPVGIVARVLKNAIQKREGGRSREERPNDNYSCSLRAFFRLRLRASASFTRFFSPGFR